jgi:phage terminase large subunit
MGTEEKVIKQCTPYNEEDAEFVGEESEDEGPRAIHVTLNVPQAQFLALKQKFRAFVAGYGSGKTWVGCSSAATHFMEFPRVNAGYFAPTYPQIRDIFYPTVEEALFAWGFDVKINASNKEVALYRGAVYYGTILCRSMDHPETIVGFKIGKALVDEIDVMKTEKAFAAWRKIIARMRYNVPGLLNGIDITTTPEGFRFVYQQFVAMIKEHPERASLYGIIQASTYSNRKNLPKGYIDSLLESYPPNLIAAYLNGQFINLQTGTVYNQFNRTLNDCKDVVDDSDIVIKVGMDFNVGKMAGIVHVLRNGEPRAVAEVTGAYDTPDMINKLRERYWKFVDGRWVKTRSIVVYPDASGTSKKSVDASASDISLLKDAGFLIKAERQNPPVKDRVNSMNAMFCNAKGYRRYKVNVTQCPVYTSALEQQPWDLNGEPDKSTGHDHPNDAGGYYIVHDFGITKRVVKSSQMFA